MTLIPTPVLTDGIIPTGAGPGKITILETAIDYILDNISRDPKTTDVRRKTGTGRPGGRKIIQEFIDGSGDIQIADENTPVPLGSMSFAADVDRDGNIEAYMVGTCGDAQTAEGEIKAKMTFARFANPCIYSTGYKTTDQLYAGISSASTMALGSSLQMAAYFPPDLTISASNPWSVTGLPAGLTMSTSTGAISGTPSTPGTNYVVVKVTATRTFVKNGVVTTETLTGRREFVWTIT